MTGCIYCDKKNEKRDRMMLPVAMLKSGMLYLYKNQAHPGHCVLALKEHVASLQDCSDQQKAEVSADLGMMTGVIRKIAGTECLAVSAAANRDTQEHLHYHILPQYVGEEDPISGKEPQPVMISEDDAQKMAEMFQILIARENPEGE